MAVLPVREIPSGDYVQNGGFSVGPDNNVWFTEQKHVARITPAGVITEFTYPSAATSNTDGATAAGPDGNVWFTEYQNGKVGKINPTSHVITEYDVSATPNFCANPAQIVAGPDGNMYFECAYTYLGQITTAGVAQRFYDAYGTSYVAQGLIKGPDGNPWFADQNGDFIGEFNPSDQSFKTYVPPYTGGTIYNLAIGPDGNIWAHENIAHTDVFIIHTLVVTPNKLTFTATGQTAFLTVTEPGTTAWTATSVSPGVCSVAQSSPANKFKVTAAGLGTTSITIKDTIGNYFVIPCHV